MSTSNASIGMPLFNARATDGSQLTSQPKPGSFQLLPTPAGGFALISEPAAGTGFIVTDTVILPVVVPSNYVAGANALSLNLNVAAVSQNKSANVPRSILLNSTVSVSVGRPNADGSVTAIPVTTPAQNMPAAGPVADYSELTFDINGSSINPGDLLLVSVQAQFSEAGTVQTQAMICAAQLVAAVQNYQAA
ncbi:MAG TPA: hypothetical protein V6C86_04670 [Oculatellaceae cyanobacterium]